MKHKKNILKNAGVLLIVIVMVLSTAVASVNPENEQLPKEFTLSSPNISQLQTNMKKTISDEPKYD
ncbi:MAG: hypothetical protein KAS76_03410 [Thermoplasmatales archaeon]|nr:hypothetical protein [Thermoplasmatales archaeon]MCK4996055.1 hypothetical protein [Thermoplasmatales archaeon]